MYLIVLKYQQIQSKEDLGYRNCNASLNFDRKAKVLFKWSFWSDIAKFRGFVFPAYSWLNNSYFYIEKWTFKIMCEVCYRAKRDKKEAT